MLFRSDQEIDQYLRERQSQQEGRQELSLAQILIPLEENATPQRLSQIESQAREIAQRARANEDFAQLARTYSTAADRVNGGLMGLRPQDRYPSLFVEAVRQQPKNANLRVRWGRMLIEPEVIRMLLFGLALVLMMLYRPAGLLPAARRRSA